MPFISQTIAQSAPLRTNMQRPFGPFGGGQGNQGSGFPFGGQNQGMNIFGQNQFPLMGIDPNQVINILSQLLNALG